jgi:hypothetical protein
VGRRSRSVPVVAERLPPEPEVLDPAVSDELVDQVHAEIRAMQREATVDLAVRMGELIVKRFYRGKLEAFREHGPREASLRKLARRFEDDDGTGLSAAGIYRAVAFYELDRRLGITERKHLTVTHIRALLGLPEADQESLLALTDERQLTSTELEKRAEAARKRASGNRGRPRLPAFLKTTNHLARLASEVDAFADLELVHQLDDDDREEARRKVIVVRERLAMLEAALTKSTPDN